MAKQWHFSKDDFYKNKPPSDDLVLASDIKEGSGAKKFTSFPSFDTLIDYLESNKNQHFYEVIPDARNYAVFLGFDIDQDMEYVHTHCESHGEYTEFIENKFREKFEEFMEQVYGICIQLTIGSNYQVSQSINTNKLSLHIKLNIKCNNFEHAKRVAQTFVAYLSSNIYTTPDERFNFFYTKNNKPVCIIDQSIYTNFRSIRTLYSSKKGKNNMLIPYKTSSANIKDHIFLFHDDYAKDILYMVMPTAPLIDIIADFSKIDDTEVVVKKVSTKEWSRNQKITTSTIPLSLLAQITQNIISHPTITALFTNPITIKNTENVAPSIVNFFIDPKCHAICPYAGRTHRSNRSFFEYHHYDSLLKYKCFDEECSRIQRNHCHIIKLNKQLPLLLNVNKLNNDITLHCNDKIIKWDQLYNHNKMYNYPRDQSMICIRANMGIGKTQQIIKMFKEFVDTPFYECKKILFITYSRVLANKYAAAFKDLGFVNYLDMQDEYIIMENKVIVCLDSLHRIGGCTYDYVVIDEVLSVLMHFNSPFMNHDYVMSFFEMFLKYGTTVFLLDAHVDNMMVHEVVDFICQERNIKPFWIKNQHVRETNRKAILFTNKVHSQKNYLYTKCIEKVMELIEKNKKVVVTSSTAQFTKDLETKIKAKYPTKELFVYNSATDSEIKYEHSLDPHKYWSKADILIYSPTITAGVSFEIPHFDCLVAYMENSTFTPSVDLTIQQLFRVRNLQDGDMFLYMNDYLKFDPENRPTDIANITQWLDSKIGTLQKYFPNEKIPKSSTIIAQGKIVYDKTKLSFKILQGIVYNVNKSLLHFTDILKATLIQDYNIPIKEINVNIPKDDLDKAIKLYDEIKKERDDTLIPYDFDDIPVKQVFDWLDEKYKRGESLTANQKQRRWNYIMYNEIWKVDKWNVNEDFYKNFIGPAKQSEKAKMFQKYYACLRFIDTTKYTLEENRNRLVEKVKEYKGDSNMSKFRDKYQEYFQKLITGQDVWMAISNNTPIKKMIEDGVTLKTSDIYERVSKYLTDKDADWLDRTRKIFQMDKKIYETIEKVKESSKLSAFFVSSIMKDCFMVNITYDTHAFDKTFACPMWKDMKDKYRSNLFMKEASISNYSFVDFE